LSGSGECGAGDGASQFTVSPSSPEGLLGGLVLGGGDGSGGIIPCLEEGSLRGIGGSLGIVGSGLPSKTCLIGVVSADIGLGSCSLGLSSGIEVVEESGDALFDFLGDGGSDSGLSGFVGDTPGTIGSDGDGNCIISNFLGGLGIRDGLGKVGDVIGSLAGGDGTGSSISLESGELLLEITLEGLADLVLGWLGLGLGGGEHQWDCDVLKHFAK
jgi:hypothetical protein